MGIEYTVDLSWYKRYSHKGSFLKKIEEYTDRLLRESEGKRIIITHIELFPTETLRDYINICVLDEKMYVYWYKDGNLHKEDGPAVVYYEFNDYKLIRLLEKYYYEGNWCYKLSSCGIESKKNNLERNFGYLVLDAGKINNKIIWLKILSKESIEDRYYWLI